MKRLFFEEKTGRYTTTLAEAKRTALQKRSSPYIYRVWMDGDNVVGKALIYAYGESVSTIRHADKSIARHINKDENQ